MLFILLIGLLHAVTPAPSQEDDAAIRAAIQKAATAAWEAHLAGTVTAVELHVLRFGGEIDPNLPLRVHFPARPAVPRGRSQVTVEALIDSIGWQKAGWAWLNVAHFDSVAIAQRVVTKDEALAAEDAVGIWMDITKFPGTPLHPRVLRERVASETAFLTKTVTANRPLRLSDIRPPYAADTGDSVIMHYNRNGVSLELSCKARGRGLTGDIIRLYSPTSKRTYRARLTAAGRADWIETQN